ncbi:MAG: creatininase family protein [Candidatus Dormibacteraeota bacterium]|nr:creatininase family protein [Candidatus Dormibacteraeota bacterium]
MRPQTIARLVEMTRAEANEAAPESLLIIPLGATEQHGPHLPVGTDTMLVELIAERALLASRDSFPAVLGPTLPLGSSAHHIPFGGTLSMTTLSFYNVLMDIGRSAASGGFRRMFYLNGHGGNHELAQVAARDLGLELPIAVGAGSWWAMAYDALTDAGGPVIRNIPGHAGGFETAVMMAMAGHLIREPRPKRADQHVASPIFRSDYRTEIHGSWEAIDGFTDSPEEATAELGSLYIKVAVSKVAADLGSFYTDSQSRLTD